MFSLMVHLQLPKDMFLTGNFSENYNISTHANDIADLFNHFISRTAFVTDGHKVPWQDDSVIKVSVYVVYTLSCYQYTSFEFRA